MSQPVANSVRPSRETVGERAFKHGHTVNGYSPTYSSWLSMNTRCNNPNNPNYPFYGGRGITICDRWRSFDLFLKDMGERPSLSLSLDRINNDLGYSPDNCRWADQKTQVRNSRRARSVERSDGVVFGTLEEAAISVGGKSASILDACAGRQKGYKGFVWRYAQ